MAKKKCLASRMPHIMQACPLEWVFFFTEPLSSLPLSLSKNLKVEQIFNKRPNSFSSKSLCSREGVPVVRVSTTDCPETAVRSLAVFCYCSKSETNNRKMMANGCSATFSGRLFWAGALTEVWQSRRASWVLAPALEWRLSIKLIRLKVLVLNISYFCFAFYLHQLVHCLCEELVVTLVARVDSNTGVNSFTSHLRV